MTNPWHRFAARVWRGWALACMALLGAAAHAEAFPPKVRLQLKWQHQFQFAGYYAAKELGYYRDAGLDVDIAPSAPDEDAMQTVLRGDAEYGVGTTDLLLLRQQGAPVVALAVIFQHSPLVLLTTKKSGIQSLHGLAGKPLMIEAGSAELFAYLRREGLTADHLRLLPHRSGTADLAAGRVAAMSAYLTDEPFELLERGMDFQVMSPRAGGIDFYGDNLFTTESELRRHPERVKAFRAASLRGWKYAMQHPEEIARLIHARYDARHGIEHLLFEARQMAPLLQVALVETGHMYAGRWRHIAEVYGEIGLLKGEVDLAGFLYDARPSPPDYLKFYLAGGLLLALAVGSVLLAIYIHQTNLRLAQAKALTDRSLEEQRQFLAMVSHEFRSPLGSIAAAAQVIEDRCGACAQSPQAVIARIRRSTERLALLLDNCLADNRFETYGWPLRREAVDLAALARNVIEYMQPLAAGHAIELNVDAALPALQGDAELLRILLRNLVENAVKYSPAGGPVTVSIGRAADGAGVRLAVADRGIGLLPDERDKIFGRYFRGRQAGGAPGAGLGLALVRRIAELHGGDIDVASEPGRGSTFAVSLPAAA